MRRWFITAIQTELSLEKAVRGKTGASNSMVGLDEVVVRALVIAWRQAAVVVVRGTQVFLL
jgi:hypothetical protein